MPRKPKAKDGLTAGQRVALYEAEQEKKRLQMQASADVDAATVTENGGNDAVKEIKKAPRALPKPQHATVKVDLAVEVGRIRPMHAMCNGPRSFGSDISHLFREAGIPLVGQFGACSTMGEGLSLSALTVNAGYAKRAAAITSSHFCTAERQ